MKKWNKLIALGVISTILAMQTVGCGNKPEEEEQTFLDMLEKDKEMAENNSEPDVAEASEEETESESESEPEIIPWEEAGLEDHVMDWKGQEAIEKQMRSKVCNYEEDLMLSDVWEVQSLDLRNAAIISDLSPLLELENLNTLSVSNTTHCLEDVSKLKQLKKLYIPCSGLSDISFLSELTNLTDLDISENEISDLTPLSGLKNLENLYVYSNNITDLSPLAELKNLKTLDLRYNEGITDYSPVSFVENLEYERTE